MIEVQIGDSRHLIHGLIDKSIDCVMTSPPYWGLRDYKTEPIVFDGLSDCEHEWVVSAQPSTKMGLAGSTQGEYSQTHRDKFYKAEVPDSSNFCSLCGAWHGQLGLEPTPELFIKHLLDFFDDVKLKLKDEGNVFINLGDTYSGSGCGTNDYRTEASKSINGIGKNAVLYKTGGIAQRLKSIPAKCLCFIPERVAIGMIDRGWLVRNKIIWVKPNHMPESVTDRLTKAHEVIYHFVKQGKYYYNLDAIREPHKEVSKERVDRAISNDHKYIDNPEYGGGSGINKPRPNKKTKIPSNQAELFGSPRGRYHREFNCSISQYQHTGGDYLVVNLNPKGKNPGDVWEVTTVGYPESHFAVFPLELVRRPILAGCPPNGTVLDPFAGSGTVGEFCRHNDRNAILFELNPKYKKFIEDRAMLLIPELSEWCSAKEDA